MSTEMESRLERERLFHDDRFSDGDSRADQKRFYWAIADGSSRFIDSVLKAAENADVLEYGCGDAENHQVFAPHARSYIGIDISEAAISRLSASHTFSNVKHLTMDAHSMTFSDDSFDLVFGSGIIHHLDTELSAKEICRVLRPTGKSIFWEPLGANPLINIYRAVTPNARTPDEHPLMPKDFKIIHKYFGEIEMKYYGLFTIGCIPFQNSTVGKAIFSAAKKLDHFVLSLPVMRWLAWYVLIICKEPKKQPA
jgi:SAM-dependent methyltransferase